MVGYLFCDVMSNTIPMLVVATEDLANNRVEWIAYILQ